MAWWFGGLVVWWFGGLGVWRFVGLVVWWFGGLGGWWFGGLVYRSLTRLTPGDVSGFSILRIFHSEIV